MFSTLGVICPNSKLFSVTRLLSESTALGLKSTLINPYLGPIDMVLEDMDFAKTLIFHRTTGVHKDDRDIEIARLAQSKGAKIVNSPEEFLPHRNKLSSYNFLKTSNLPLVPTLSLRGKPKMLWLEEFIEKNKDYFETNSDFILKPEVGNRGIGVNKISGTKELYSWLETFWALKDQSFIIQPFLDYEYELRFLHLGKNDFRLFKKINNKFLQLKDAQISEDLLALAKKAFVSSKLSYGAVDILVGGREPIILEVNSIPGIEKAEAATSENLAKLLIQNFL